MGIHLYIIIRFVLFSQTMYNGLVMYGPAIALEGAVGVPFWVSILAIAVSSILYTAIVSMH